MDFPNQIIDFSHFYECMADESTTNLKKFFDFYEHLKDKTINIINPKLNKIIQNYEFIHITYKWNVDDNQQIIQNLINSKIIIINKYEVTNQEKNFQFLIIVFEKTIIAIDSRIIYVLGNLLNKTQNLKICYLSKTKELFVQGMFLCFIYEEIFLDSNSQVEISSFNSNFVLRGNELSSLFPIWKVIQTSLSTYFIQNGYLKFKEDRFERFISQKTQFFQNEITDDDFIGLRSIGTGSSSDVDLIYHIENESLFALKKINTNDPKAETLFKREIKNYSKINSPSLPGFFGIVSNKKHLVIEFINGQTLIKKINDGVFLENKLSYIFQLMIIIEYFHQKHFILRDLKPDNIIIDSNNNVILIDFDRMISDDDRSSNELDFTNEFASIFVAPEVNYGDFSYSCDVYSLGKIIYYIFNEDSTELKNCDENQILNQIYKKCILLDADERPPLSNLIIEFYLHFYEFIDLDSYFFDAFEDCLTNIYDKNTFYTMQLMLFDKSHPIANYNIGLMFIEGKYIEQDIDLAIYHYQIAADEGLIQAQFNLALIYHLGPSSVKDIDKAKYYYFLSAEQNCLSSQMNLGIIYSEQNDFENAKKYFKMAAEQNSTEAQYLLGFVYFKEGDLNQAISYLLMASDKNLTEAQFLLGFIFTQEQFGNRFINEAIKYLTKAAENKYLKAQTLLGYIYETGYYIIPDIKMALYYYKLAAENNDSYAQFRLGYLLYNENPRLNFDKYIQYFIKSAKSNNEDAQIFLGCIFYEGNYTPKDIERSIYYLKLAEKNNNPIAQLYLGEIYKNININKAIYYYTKSAEQNNVDALFDLGFLYYKCDKVQKDINKAIHYFKLASNLNNSKAQLILGLIYYEGKVVSKNIDKSIYYYTLSAKLNNEYAQFYLGIIYFEGTYVKQNINKAIDLIKQSAENIEQKNYNACFFIGFLYHEGIYINEDINESIKFYKEASSFNNQYAKNNLAVIYKNKFKNIQLAIEYLNEAIKQNKATLAMYNLANIYCYHLNDLDKSINLLFKSLFMGFKDSLDLLCLVLVKKIGFNLSFTLFEQKLNDLFDLSNDLKFLIYQLIKTGKIDDEIIFQEKFQYYEKIDYLYDQFIECISSINFPRQQNKEILKQNQAKDISSDFYEGFDIIF